MNESEFPRIYTDLEMYHHALFGLRVRLTHIEYTESLLPAPPPTNYYKKRLPSKLTDCYVAKCNGTDTTFSDVSYRQSCVPTH